MKITIKEWDASCVEGREYNGKIALWWCTPAGCVQSVDPPPDKTAGPFNSKADCNEGCGTATAPDQPPGNSWWCIYGILVQGTASPHPDATGPFTSTTEANCGPAQMVWHCGETGPAKISRWEAVQRGFQYWATEQEVIDAGCVLKWYCGTGGCGSFTSPPIGSTGGPYDNEANCQASCQSGAVKYWCVAQPGGGLNQCVQSIDPPPGTVSGPFITSGQCFENCNLSISPPPVVGPVSTQSAQIQRVTLPCLHLGDNLEDPATCGCGTAVLRSCAVHGQCRKTGYPKAGEAICLTCPDYQAPQTGQA